MSADASTLKEYCYVLPPMSLWEHAPRIPTHDRTDGFAPYERLPENATICCGSVETGSGTEALRCETDGVISVEFVRSEDDSWILLINGAKSNGSTVNSDNPALVEYEHSLPPPFSQPLPVDSTSSADRIVVGVRLESGALRPAKVELFVETVLSEREETDDRYVARENKSLKAGDLRHYAVEDPWAEATVLPYPIYAPKQSTVALVSFDEAARFKDRYDTRIRHLLWSSFGTPKLLKDLLAPDSKDAIGRIDKAVNETAQLPPSAPPAGSNRTHVFGDGAVSSSKALLIAVCNIVDVCERVAHDEAGEHIRKAAWDQDMLDEIRAGLTVFKPILSNAEDSLALLDGLCLIQDIHNPVDTAMGFIWEDVALKLQTRATAVKYKCLITELNGDTTSHVLSCSPECGFFAHALATSLATDIELLCAELDKLTSCIMGDHAGFHSDRWKRIPHNPFVEKSKGKKQTFKKDQLLLNIATLKARYTITGGGEDVFPAPPGGHWRVAIPHIGKATIKRTLQQVVKTRTVWPVLVKHHIPIEMSDGWDATLENESTSTFRKFIKAAATVDVVVTGVMWMVSQLTTESDPIVLMSALIGLYTSVKSIAEKSTLTVIDKMWNVKGAEQKIRMKLVYTARQTVKRAAAASSYDNALVAIRNIRVSESTASNRVLTSGYTRFHFVQLYESDKHVSIQPNQTPTGHVSYDTDIFQLSAPDDILRHAASMVEERRIPVLEAIRVLVGSPNDAVLTTASQTAAHAAHCKLISLLSVDRQTLKGRHLSGSVHELALVVASRAIALINGAYTRGVEDSSPPTLTPTGDDHYWLCFQSGRAARVALKYIPSFARWGQTMSLNDSDRRCVAEFSQDWKEEAVRVASIAARSVHPIVHESAFQTVRQTRQLCRFNALTDDIELTTLLANGSRLTTDALRLVLTYASFAAPLETLPGPTHHHGFRYRNALRAAVAARRLDVHAFSDLKLVSDDGVNSVSDQLLNISLTEGVRKMYYFPMGYSLLVAPGATPFDPSSLGARVVSLERLLDIQSQYTGEYTRVTTNSSGVILRHAKEPKGLQRHPLVIATDGDIIEICYPEFPSPLHPGKDRAVRLQHAVLRARALLFAAERVYSGLGLALVRGSPLGPVCLQCGNGGPRSIDSAVTLVVSLAMIEADIGCSIESVGVYPSLVLSSQEEQELVSGGLKLMANTLNKALSRGCRSVQLSELVIALSL